MTWDGDIMDMPTIRVKCSICYEHSEMAPEGIKATLFTTGPMTWEFFCPACHQHNRKVLQEGPALATFQVLVDAGVAGTLVEVPEEVLEHPGPRIPKLTNDDLIKFVLALDGMSTADAQ